MSRFTKIQTLELEAFQYSDEVVANDYDAPAIFTREMPNFPRYDVYHRGGTSDAVTGATITLPDLIIVQNMNDLSQFGNVRYSLKHGEWLVEDPSSKTGYTVMTAQEFEDFKK